MSEPTPLEAIFFAALAKAPGERAAYLNEACAGDESLRHRVERMLAAQLEAGSFLETPSSAVVIDSGPTTNHSPPERPGTQIGPYKLLQQVGEGGMGVVYMAEQAQPVERRVALKIIKPGMDSRQVVARFEAERQALAMMDHPNIAKVFEAGTTDSGRPYFVMELVKGVPITKYCDEKHLSLKERLELLIPVCQAIQHAHQKGIIHRDIKPNNVLVAQYDGKPVPKVIDFGVAKATAQKLTERTMFTELGQIVGTLEYMSPEQAELNQLDIDTRSDIYSLGVLLYELLTGSTPFDKQKLRTAAFHEMLRIIREDEPPKPSANLSTSGTLASISANRHSEPARLCKAVRGELDWIVMKALEKDRNRRYETANGLASDIQRYLNDEHVQACPPSARYRFGKFARKNRASLTTAAIVALALLIGTAVSTWQAVRATNAQTLARANEVLARKATESERAAKQAETIQRQRAEDNAAEAQKQEKMAKEQLALATAITEFLQDDILGQAGSEAQVDRKFEPNPNLTIHDALDRAIKSVGDKFKNRPLQEASIRATVGNAYSAIGNYEQAICQLRQSAALRKSQLGPEHRDTLCTLNNLAQAYLDAGKTTEAIALHEQVRDTTIKNLGPNHVDTLTEITCLAVAYQADGKATEAIALLEQVRDVELKLLGPEHPTTLSTLQCLASSYGVTGKTSEATALAEQVRTAQVKILGPEHPRTLSTLNNLAGYYGSSGKMTEAIALLEQVRDAQVKILGPEHPSTLNTLNNLASAYWKTKQLDKSIPLFEQVQEATRKKLGESHPDRLMTMFNLGANYRDAGRLAEAIPLLERAHREIRIQPSLNMTANALCEAYIRAGMTVEALALVKESIAAARNSLPAGSKQLADVLNHYGSLLEQIKAWSDAEPVIRECLAIREKLAPDAWSTFSTRSWLGQAMLELKQYADAEPLLLAGYAGLKQREEEIPADRKHFFRYSLSRLVRLYDSWGKQDEAAHWRAELMAWKRASEGEEKPPAKK